MSSCPALDRFRAAGGPLLLRSIVDVHVTHLTGGLDRLHETNGDIERYLGIGPTIGISTIDRLRAALVDHPDFG